MVTRFVKSELAKVIATSLQCIGWNDTFVNQCQMSVHRNRTQAWFILDYANNVGWIKTSIIIQLCSFIVKVFATIFYSTTFNKMIYLLTVAVVWVLCTLHITTFINPQIPLRSTKKFSYSNIPTLHIIITSGMPLRAGTVHICSHLLWSHVITG